jgi:hypothetical protein
VLDRSTGWSELDSSRAPAGASRQVVRRQEGGKQVGVRRQEGRQAGRRVQEKAFPSLLQYRPGRAGADRELDVARLLGLAPAEQSRSSMCWSRRPDPAAGGGVLGRGGG